MYAYCYASGLIEFGKRVPRGAIAIAKATSEPPLRELFIVTARHGYEPNVLLVPGVPEAPNQTEGVKALKKFCEWIATYNEEGVTILGV